MLKFKIYIPITVVHPASDVVHSSHKTSCWLGPHEEQWHTGLLGDAVGRMTCLIIVWCFCR